jgi:hypothetical protein
MKWTSEIRLCIIIIIIIIITLTKPPTHSTPITPITANINRYITAATVLLQLRLVHFLFKIYHIRSQVF